MSCFGYIIAVVVIAAVTPPDEDGPCRRVRPPGSVGADDLVPCCLCPLSAALLLPTAH